MSTLIPTEKVSIFSDMNKTTEQVELVQTCQITFTIPMDCVEKVGKYVKNVLSNYHKDCAGNLIRNTKENVKKSTKDSTTTKQKKKDSPSRAKRRLKRLELKEQTPEKVSDAEQCPLQKSESSETDSIATTPPSPLLMKEGEAQDEDIQNYLKKYFNVNSPWLVESSSRDCAAEEKHEKVKSISDTEQVSKESDNSDAEEASTPISDCLKHELEIICELINNDNQFSLIKPSDRYQRTYLSEIIANDSKLYDLFKMRPHHPKTVDEHIKFLGGTNPENTRKMFTFYNVIKYITQNSELAICDYAPIDLHQLYDYCGTKTTTVAVKISQLTNESSIYN